MSVHVFGIRHHGVGSARSLRAALETLRPDAVLIEGPPDADKIIPLAGHPEMRPPIALLVYRPDLPNRAVWYPFALFSPEWQAIQYGLQQGIPVQFMDLPQKHALAEARGEEGEPPASPEPARDGAEPEALSAAARLRLDPLSALAEVAGFEDGEQWWERMVEERRAPPSEMEPDGPGVFTAIREAMSALRGAAGDHPNPYSAETEARREAWMRKTIRASQKRHKRVAVVCGAWHAPALEADALDDSDLRDADAARLEKLPSVSVRATWAPWTYGRLARDSGYGAGIASPGWYQHLWETPPERIAAAWLARVAALLREADLLASTSQVIDAVQLAEALAALRERPTPGLAELNEATLAVFCRGDSTPLKLVWDKLIVSDALGAAPAEAAAAPLQHDLETQQRALRLKPEPEERILDLDLRKPNDLARSRLLHRLALLDIPWGTPHKSQVQATGTFHEFWRLIWQPELSVAVIEASAWGNTVEEAAAARVRHAAEAETRLDALTRLLEHLLLAELPAAAEHLIRCLQNLAALTVDIAALMDALPALVNAARYGSVRRTDASLLLQIVEGLVARICVGLPPACVALDDESAGEMFARIVRVNGAVGLLQDEALTGPWQSSLRHLMEHDSLHGLIRGRATRILRDAGALSQEETTSQLRRSLSAAVEPAQAAAWLDGFLRDSGAILLHDEALWQSLDQWVSGLAGETFEALLPLLRRTFSTFHAPERRQMGERVRAQAAPGHTRGGTRPSTAIDAARAARVLPLLGQILGAPPREGRGSV